MTMQELWDGYRAEVLPADAPAVQVAECRRAFYGGAHAVLMGLVRVFDIDREPTAADLCLMGEIMDELDAFNVAVKAGAA